MTRITALLAIAACASLSTPALAAGDSAGPVDAKALAAPCAACHGEGGVKPILPSYPIIGGQYEDYLVHALNGYRDGSRKNAIMAGQVASMSDEQIEALADYFAKQDSPLYTPRIEHGSGAQ